MGGFAQIYSGGVVNACRHAVLRQSAEAGVARATYCNFWYAPWDLLCVPASGAREAAVNTGWNPNPEPNPNPNPEPGPKPKPEPNPNPKPNPNPNCGFCRRQRMRWRVTARWARCTTSR